MMLLQIKEMNGKNSSVTHTQALTGNSEIHSTDPVPEITLSQATQRHDNYAEQLVIDFNDNGNDGWSEVKRENFRSHRYSITRTRYYQKCWKDENFCTRRRKQTFRCIYRQRLHSYHLQLFTAVKLKLIIKTEQLLSIRVKYLLKWELRSQDKRVAQSVPNIFYELKKLQIKQIQNSTCISPGKRQAKGKKYITGDLKLDDYVNKLNNQEEGFRVLNLSLPRPDW